MKKLKLAFLVVQKLRDDSGPHFCSSLWLRPACPLHVAGEIDKDSQKGKPTSVQLEPAEHISPWSELSHMAAWPWKGDWGR